MPRSIFMSDDVAAVVAESFAGALPGRPRKRDELQRKLAEGLAELLASRSGRAEFIAACGVESAAPRVPA